MLRFIVFKKKIGFINEIEKKMRKISIQRCRKCETIIRAKDYNVNILSKKSIR